MFCCNSESIATTCFPDSPAFPTFEYRYKIHRANSSSFHPNLADLLTATPTTASASAFPPSKKSTKSSNPSHLTMNKIAVCIKDGEDGVTVVGVVPRGHVAAPFLPLGLTIPATVVFADCVAIAARVNCDGTVTSLGPPKDLPSVKGPGTARRFDAQALKDAIGLYGPFKRDLTQEFLGLFGVRLVDRPYLMCVSQGDKTLELPFGHSIYRVSKIEWVAVTPANFVSLSPPQQDNSHKRPQLSKKDLNRLQHFLGWDWGEADSLLFAEAIDVCSVFPFGCTPVPQSASASASASTWTQSQRQDKFGSDWGRNLRQPFDDANLGQLCTPFTRGFALGTIFTVAPPRKSSQAPQNSTTTTTTITMTTELTSPTSNNEAKPAAVSQQLSSSSSPSSPPLTPQTPQNPNQQQQQQNLNERGAPSENVLFFFMMGIQNSGNPGPRFYGRGLNEEGFVGNDLVYQLVAWKYSRSQSSGWEVHWSRHCFLRGTVPIRFKNKVAKGIGEATIVLKEDALDGSAEYLTEQVEKCDLIASIPANPVADAVGDPVTITTTTTTTSSSNAVSAANDNAHKNNNSSGNDNDTVSGQHQQQSHLHPNKLRCINLLKSVSQAGEHRLGAVFDQSVKRLAANTGLPIDIAHIDWLGIEAKYGIEASATRIWNVALLFLDGDGSSSSQPASAGRFPLQTKAPPPPASPSASAKTSAHIVTQQQNRYIRYNCADSLDRTNVASFFVVAQICSRLFLLLDVVPERLQLRVSANPMLYETAPTPKAASTTSSSANNNNANNSSKSDFGELAEAKEDLDELQEMPPESELPPCFYHSIQDFAEHMPEPLMQALVELFITNGDTIAKLFTATGAIHTSHMRKFVAGMRSAPSNAILSAQRRFENIFRDKKKYRVVDILVGKDTKTYHFPSVPPHYFVWPLRRRQWPNAIVVKIAGLTKLIGADELKKALFRDSDEKQRKVVEIREAILAAEASATLTSPSQTSTASSPIPSQSNLNISSGTGAAATNLLSPVNNNNNNIYNSANRSSGNQHQSVASAAAAAAAAIADQSSASPLTQAIDDDVPRDQDNADFSFLTFDRFYMAVVLFESPQVVASILQSDAASSKVPFHERKVFVPLDLQLQQQQQGEKVTMMAQISFYLYEQATEETTACLKVKQAAEITSASSPLAKLSNFAKNLFK